MEQENKVKRNPLLDKLYQAWAGTFDENPTDTYAADKEYISAADKKILNENPDFFKNYKTHVIPLPFWGNIEDPEYIVLGLNPSYEPLVDELESLQFYEQLKNTIKGDCDNEKINWLDENFDIRKTMSDNLKEKWNLSLDIKKLDEIRENMKVEATNKWWNKVFDDEVFNVISKKELSKKFGFFNLCGYHSKSFIDKGISKIPTVKATVEYVKFLIKNEERKIVLIWGSNWKDYIFQAQQEASEEMIETANQVKCITDLENKNRLLIVNSIHSQNKSLKAYKAKNEEQYKAFFKDISELKK